MSGRLYIYFREEGKKDLVVVHDESFEVRSKEYVEWERAVFSCPRTCGQCPSTGAISLEIGTRGNGGVSRCCV
jgi:hypothetical protein